MKKIVILVMLGIYASVMGTCTNPGPVAKSLIAQRDQLVTYKGLLQNTVQLLGKTHQTLSTISSQVVPPIAKEVTEIHKTLAAAPYLFTGVINLGLNLLAAEDIQKFIPILNELVNAIMSAMGIDAQGNVILNTKSLSGGLSHIVSAIDPQKDVHGTYKALRKAIKAFDEPINTINEMLDNPIICIL